MSGSWYRSYDHSGRKPPHGESNYPNREEGEISRDTTTAPAATSLFSQPLISRVDPRKDQSRLLSHNDNAANSNNNSSSTGVLNPSRPDAPFAPVNRFAAKNDRDPRFKAHSTSPPVPRNNNNNSNSNNNNNPTASMNAGNFFHGSPPPAFPDDIHSHRNNMNPGPSWRPPDRTNSFTQRRMDAQQSLDEGHPFGHLHTPNMNRSYSTSDVGSRYDCNSHGLGNTSSYMLDGIGVPMPSHGPNRYKSSGGGGVMRGGDSKVSPWSSKPTFPRASSFHEGTYKNSDLHSSNMGILNKFDRRAPPGGWDRDRKMVHEPSTTTSRDYYGPDKDRITGLPSLSSSTQGNVESIKTHREPDYDEDLFAEDHQEQTTETHAGEIGYDVAHSSVSSGTAVSTVYPTMDESGRYETIPTSGNKPVVVENSMDNTASSPEKKTGPVIRIQLSSLGNEDKISKAEVAIKRLSEIMSMMDDMNTIVLDGTYELPSTQQIMLGISNTDHKIKEYERDLIQLRIDRDELRKKEEQQEAEKLEREVELQKKRQLEITQKYEDLRQAESIKRDVERKKRKQDMNALKATLQALVAQKNTEVCEVQDKVKESFSREFKKINEESSTAMHSIQSSYWDDITTKVQVLAVKARELLQSEISIIHELTSTLKGNGLEEFIDEVFVDEAKEGDIFKANPSLLSICPLLRDNPKSMSDVVTCVLNESRKRAKQSHSESLSLIPCNSENDIVASTSSQPINTNGACDWTNDDWSRLTRLVTGPENALYTDPSETPLFHEHNQHYIRKRHLIRDHIRSKKRKLYHRWKELCLEYVALQRPNDRKGNLWEYSDVPSLNFESQEQLGVRGNNPYRRPRRVANLGSGSSSIGSDIVRSEYEQEQIIAKLTAQEALEKKIFYGGCSLPKQRCEVEKALLVSYQDTLSSRRVHDAIKEADEFKCQNPWSDMEKCIFLDKFLQHPKDFRKIASHLKNKSVRDCISFYYDSKQSVPYKAALKEHLLRRKRRGEPTNWEATMQAAVSVGAIISPGSSVEKPVIFSLPQEDNSYSSRYFHPLRRERILHLTEDSLFSDETVIRNSVKEDAILVGRLFSIDISQRSLPQSSCDSEQKLALNAGSWDVSQNLKPDDTNDEKVSGEAAARKIQKWTKEEKRIFLNAFEQHGKNWPLLAQAVGTKGVNQIKNYYYDNKRMINKLRSQSDLGKDQLRIPTKGKEGEVGGLEERGGEISTMNEGLHDMHYYSLGRAVQQRAEMLINSSLQQSMALAMETLPIGDLHHLQFPRFSQPYPLPFIDQNHLLSHYSHLSGHYVQDINSLADGTSYGAIGQANIPPLYHFAPNISSLVANEPNTSATPSCDFKERDDNSVQN